MENRGEEKSVQKKLKERISNQDIFGYPIQNILNINKKQNSQKTLFGGICSIILYISIIIVVSFNIKNFVDHERDAWGYEDIQPLMNATQIKDQHQTKIAIWIKRIAFDGSL